MIFFFFFVTRTNVFVNKKFSRQVRALIFFLHEADMLPHPLKKELERFEFFFFFFVTRTNVFVNKTFSR